jgi:transcriptional antiterminator NusG
MHKWYVLHALSGKEQRVKEALEERIRLHEMGDLIRQVVIPEHTVQEIRGGQKKISTRKFYPGYVLVEAELNDDSWQLIRRTQGIIGFLGGKHPKPLSSKEVADMFEQIEESKEKVAPRVKFEIGDRVKVNEGPFEGYIGSVEKVDEDRGKLDVSLTVFERITPVELEFWQVEKEQ